MSQIVTVVAVFSCCSIKAKLNVNCSLFLQSVQFCKLSYYPKSVARSVLPVIVITLKDSSVALLYSGVDRSHFLGEVHALSIPAHTENMSLEEPFQLAHKSVCYFGCCGKLLMFASHSVVMCVIMGRDCDSQLILCQTNL